MFRCLELMCCDRCVKYYTVMLVEIGDGSFAFFSFGNLIHPR